MVVFSRDWVIVFKGAVFMSLKEDWGVVFQGVFGVGGLGVTDDILSPFLPLVP